MPKNGKWYFCIFIAVLIWGSSFPVSRYLLGEIPPYSLAFLRNTITAVIFFLLLPIMKVKIDWKSVREHLFLLFCLGFTGVGIYNIFMTVGLQGTPAGKASLISSSSILFGSILAAIFLKEKLTKRKLGGLLFSMCGVVLVLTEGNFNLGKINPSDFYFFGTAISWGTYMVLTRYASDKMDTMVLMPFVFLFGAITAFIFWLPGAANSPLIGFSPVAWAGLFYMSLFSGAVAFLCSYLGVKHVGTIPSNICNTLIPVWSCVFSFLFMGESMSLPQVLGATVAVCGVLWGVTGIRSQRQEMPVTARME